MPLLFVLVAMLLLVAILDTSTVLYTMCYANYTDFFQSNKIRRRKDHTVGTGSQSNTKIIERSKIYTLSAQIDHRSTSWLGTGNNNWG